MSRSSPAIADGSMSPSRSACQTSPPLSQTASRLSANSLTKGRACGSSSAIPLVKAPTRLTCAPGFRSLWKMKGFREVVAQTMQSASRTASVKSATASVGKPRSSACCARWIALSGVRPQRTVFVNGNAELCASIRSRQSEPVPMTARRCAFFERRRLMARADAAAVRRVVNVRPSIIARACPCAASNAT